MKNVIEVNHLTKMYGNHVALDDLSFHVEEGSVFGLLGPNGAGKSSSLECILGTKKATKGEVTILGFDPTQKRKELFEHIGVQFQEAKYQELIKVEELCEVTESLYKESRSYKELLSTFGLSEKRKSYIKDLSGGERQKLFIVLALIPSPKIVFLDELTTGLDARARRDVWNILARLKENGMSILLTSHFMDEVEALCDNILILKHGKTIFTGTVEEAKKQSGKEKFEDAYLLFTDEEDTQYENL